MQNPAKIRTFALFTLCAQPAIFFSTIVAGSFNSGENGFNGMQAVFVIPIFIIVLTCFLIWKSINSKLIAKGDTRSAKLLNGLMVSVFVFAIIVDLGIFVSAFLPEYHINIFVFSA